MEERPVRADLHVVDNTRLEIHVDRTGNVLSGSGLGKESGETVLSSFYNAFLNTTVGLSVRSGLAVIMRETRRTPTLKPCSRVYSSPFVS